MVLGIFGAGGTGREVYGLILRDSKYFATFEKVVFVDDVIGVEKVEGIEVFTFQQIKEKFIQKDIQFLIALGDPDAREKVYNKIKENGYLLSTWIHPKAEIAHSVKIGEGAIIMDAYIDVNVNVGNNTFVYYKAAIGHDSVIRDNCIIAAGAFIGGHSIIEKNVYFGPGAAVRDRIHIGERAIIGLNSAVYKDIPSDCSAIGNPAKIIQRSSNGLFL